MDNLNKFESATKDDFLAQMKKSVITFTDLDSVESSVNKVWSNSDFSSSSYLKYSEIYVFRTFSWNGVPMKRNL